MSVFDYKVLKDNFIFSRELINKGLDTVTELQTLYLLLFIGYYWGV